MMRCRILSVHDVPDDDLNEPLTPKECGELAESFADLPPEFQLTAAQCEMLEEERLNKLMRYGSPREAIEAMEQRLLLLKAQKVKAVNTLDDCAEHLRPPLLQHIKELNRQIWVTLRRLEAYELQDGAQN
jgi:hypothetical protein